MGIKGDRAAAEAFGLRAKFGRLPPPRLQRTEKVVVERAGRQTGNAKRGKKKKNKRGRH